MHGSHHLQLPDSKFLSISNINIQKSCKHCELKVKEGHFFEAILIVFGWTTNQLVNARKSRKFQEITQKISCLPPTSFSKKVP